MDLEPETSELSGEKAEILTKTEIPYLLYQALNNGTCNLQSVCRGCLSVNNETQYSLLHDEKHNSDMFFKITSIQVNEGDGFPNSICGTCHEEILQFYKFKTKCLNSDQVLKTILERTLDDCVDASHDCDSQDNLEMELKETDLTVKQDEITDKTNAYLECLRYEMSSDDEAICFYQENTKDVNLVIVDKGKQSSLGNKKQYKEKISNIPKHRKPYICPHCPKKYKRKKALHGHMQKVHKLPKSAHGCEQCTDTFTCEDDLRLHQSLHNKDSVWKCNQCHKEYNVRAALRRHLQRHMSSKRYSCDVCGKQFVENYAMLRHRVVHSGLKPEKKYKCHLCDKRFADKRALDSHGVTAHGVVGDGGRGAGPCACACGKQFASRRLLASHRRVHNDDKPYACKYCDKRFRHDSARNTHHRTHTGERPYVCSVCGKTFIQHSNLTMHMRSHTGERPYSCSKCNSKFSTGSALKNHERTHTGERPYSCTVCGKRFARGSMKAHMRIHTGERPFACAVCPRRFNNASHLREHSRLHTGERPFECAMCTLKFPTKSHLIKHVALLTMASIYSTLAQEYLPPKIGGKKPAPEPTLPANYDFSYDVQDNAVSLDFGHNEKRKDDHATGSYHVLLPDGRMQLVEYEAGPDGYKPQIMYMGTATYPNGGSGDKFDGYHYNAASNRASVRQAAPRGTGRQAPAPPPAPASPLPSNATQ